MALDVRVKWVYDPTDGANGYRVLMDHVWPRCVARKRARLDKWACELAPSDELRKWFGHVPARFDEFRARYRNELAAHEDRIAQLPAGASKGPHPILYAARDQQDNNVVVLAELPRDG